MDPITGVLFVGLGAFLLREGNYSVLVVFLIVLALTGVIPVAEWVAAAR